MRQLVSVTCLAAALSLGPLALHAQQEGVPKRSPYEAGLAYLVSLPAVSGFESDVRDAIRQSAPSWARVRVDNVGNLIVSAGQGKPHLLVCADMDEDGYFVSAITDAGFLRVNRVTTGVTNRLFEQMHYGQPMFVRAAHARVPGVFVTASTHLQRGRSTGTAAKDIDDLWVDVGAGSRAEVANLGIHVLDPVSLRERSAWLANGRLSGVAAQSRAAASALQQLLEGAGQRAAGVGGTLTIALTVQGSFGERGMARLAQEMTDVDRVLVLGRTPMPRDGSNPKGAAGQLGAGVLVADADARTIDLAKQRGVPVQVANGVGAPAVWPASKTQAFALPVLYAQTPVETIAMSDVDSLVRLLCSLTGLSQPAGLGVAGSIPGGLASNEGLAGRLRPLIDVTGVSGAEKPVRDQILEQLPKWARPEIDQRGNVTVSFGALHGAGFQTRQSRGPQGPRGDRQARTAVEQPELLFVSHMDEIGYEITGVLDDGTATVRKRGGFFDFLWEAHPVFVQTAKGAVIAVVAPRPNYLNASVAAPKADEIVLYFGTASRAETQALGVAKGDTATIRKELTKLAGTRWTARSMDDRCGVAAMLDALGRIDPAKVGRRVTFAFVVGEETGLEGSGVLAEREHPDVVFAVDTFVSSDSPVDPQRMALVPLGSAVVARAIDNSSITPPETVARIADVGRAHGIPVVANATSGGNDGSQFSRWGSVVAPLSWPGRYSHSPVEVMDLRDLDNLAALIAALVNEF